MPRELTTSQPKPIDAFRHQLDKMAVEFDKVLPPHMTPDKLMRTVITSVQNNPKLLDADRNTLFSSIMTGAALGLELDGVTGQGYLVPFKGRVTFVPGYKGYITLALNSGVMLEGYVVHENDVFEYRYGTSPMIHHEPNRADPGNIAAAYATARSNHAPTAMRVMEMPALFEIRNNSAGFKGMGQKSPWVTNFEAMCRKTAIRGLGANLPLNVQRLAMLDQAYDDGELKAITPAGDVVDVDAEEV